MAKFVLNSNSVFTLGGNSLSCLTSAETSSSIDTFMSMCAGQTSKATITGLSEHTMSVSGELETDDVTALGNFAVGTSGAVNFQPNGTTAGDIAITSTNGTVVSRNESFSSSGLATVTVQINLDDMTVAANSA